MADKLMIITINPSVDDNEWLKRLCTQLNQPIKFSKNFESC